MDDLLVIRGLVDPARLHRAMIATGLTQQGPHLFTQLPMYKGHWTQVQSLELTNTVDGSFARVLKTSAMAMTVLGIGADALATTSYGPPRVVGVVGHWTSAAYVAFSLDRLPSNFSSDQVYGAATLARWFSGRMMTHELFAPCFTGTPRLSIADGELLVRDRCVEPKADNPELALLHMLRGSSLSSLVLQEDKRHVLLVTGEGGPFYTDGPEEKLICTNRALVRAYNEDDAPTLVAGTATLHRIYPPRG